MSKFHTQNINHVYHVELFIRQWERAIDFYTSKIGLNIINKTNHQVNLGAQNNQTLITLNKLENGKSKQSNTTGLYHFALLLPNRKDLGSILRHLLTSKVNIQGASHHGISEAIYLSDPDGNGIEIAADTPYQTWPLKNGGLDILTVNGPLDVKSILEEAKDDLFKGLPKETVMGHIHLHVHDLKQARHFYQNILNMNIIINIPQSAIFFSYGNYHHHLATNIWNGIGASNPPLNSVGLKQFYLWIATMSDFDQIKANLSSHNIPFEQVGDTISTQDPSNNKIIIKTQPVS